MNIHWIRFKADLKDTGHSFVNVIVEPFKRWLPWSVPGFRPDNKRGLFYYDEKPLGYWVGHLVAWLVGIGAFILLGLFAQLVLAILVCVLGGECRF